MKKKEKLLREMGEVDDAYIVEADPTRPRRRKGMQGYKRVVVAACIAALTLSLGLWLFIPFNVTPPDVSRYADSEYYEVIQRLNAVTYVKPRDKNNFEKYVEGFWRNFAPTAMEKEDAVVREDVGMEIETSSGAYVEVTDNQVMGVIEGDLFKRTRERVFYLRENTLTVYSIEGEDSRKLGSYLVKPFFDVAGYYYYNMGEIYLSADGNTVTLVMPYSINSKGAQVGLLSLDVSDPENIKEIGTVSIEGSYVSSRSVNGEILLVSRFQVGRNPDFSDPSCFIPGYKTADGEYRVPVENIVAPETLTDSCYTVISALDQNGLTMDFCTALLSYSNEIYVSGDSIYATHGYNHRVTEGQVTTSEQVTEITRVRYGEGFEIVGTATVKGSVKDQYSMDEYEGMLRVVTTTMRSKIKETIFEDGNALAEFVGGEEIGSNASLYILNADTMEIVQSVENFAPWGETVQSARFDGVSAYVCTSVQLSDPVFFFDLSDIDHITWKDTGEIAGFSSSLIQLGDGYLLGVGRGNSWDSVKIEIYEESGDGVVSVCAYEAKGYYSPTYKSYFIDREERLLGVPINFIEGVHAGRDLYVLLHFDGYQLVEIVTVPTDGYGEMIRAFMDEGYLYVYGRFGFDVAYVGG